MTTPRIILHEQADPDTIDAAMAVMVEAFAPRFGEAWNADQLAGMLDLPGSWLLLARAGETPVGFALIRMVFDEAELLLIGVRPQWQRRAVGRQLMDAALARIGDKGGRLVHIEVRQGNPAIAFYEDYDFTVISRRSAYYKGDDGVFHDALTLQRKV